MTVVDTNVLVVANNRPGELSENVTTACIRAATSFLNELKTTGHVAIDDGYRILNEYRRRVSAAGQPGAGDAFFKWLWDTHADDERCTRVPLVEHPTRGFDSFPTAADLTTFDPSDRKFVAVARLAPAPCPIAFAADRGWRRHATALTREGVALTDLCP